MNTYSINEEFFKDYKNALYVGLTNKRISDITFNEVKTIIKHGHQNNLSQFQEFVLFIMKSRLNLDFKELEQETDLLFRNLQHYEFFVNGVMQAIFN